jgi:DNA-binding response OmpR family regulator
MPSILSVSYDEPLLITRQRMLEGEGYTVKSVCSLDEAVEVCGKGTTFDLLLLGHSIPQHDKELLIKAFRATCSAPVLALRRPGDETVLGADVVIEPDHPRVLLDSVATALTTAKPLPPEGLRTRPKEQAG